VRILIYATTACPYCKALKDYLTSKNIPFSEKLVDMDEKAKEEMATLSNGFLGVPFTVITDDSGNRNTIVGFDKGRIDKILQVKQ